MSTPGRTRRTRQAAIRCLATLLVLGAVATPEQARGAADPPLLTAVVGPGHGVSFTRAGAPVTQLAPGSYVVRAIDRSSLHDLHLVGPGVDRATSVRGQGATTWHITLRAGGYSLLCDIHGAGGMRIAFDVGHVAPVAQQAATTISVDAFARTAALGALGVMLVGGGAIAVAASRRRGRPGPLL